VKEAMEPIGVFSKVEDAKAYAIKMHDPDFQTWDVFQFVVDQHTFPDGSVE
jgi:hypothetical protein